MITRTEKNKKKQKQVTEIEIKTKRKKRILFFSKFIFIILLILSGIFLSLRYIGTSGIMVNEYSFQYNNLPSSFNGFKIIQFSDINYGSSIAKKELNNIIKKINTLKPDLILFTGGLKYKEYKITSKDKENLISTLSNLKPSVGKYYIIGDNDDEETVEIFDKSEFVFLNNSSELIYFKGIIPISINGIIDNYNITVDKNLFNITMIHKPDTADAVLNTINSDIILAGHSLNGQLRLPYFGALIKFDGSKKYYDSYYKIKNTDLFISGGLGTNTYPFRLFNHPSINFFRLKSK